MRNYTTSYYNNEELTAKAFPKLVKEPVSDGEKKSRRAPSGAQGALADSGAAIIIIRGCCSYIYCRYTVYSLCRHIPERNAATKLGKCADFAAFVIVRHLDKVIFKQLRTHGYFKSGITSRKLKQFH